jgi:hypothetical protein
VNFNLGKTAFLGAEARYLALHGRAPVATPYSGSSTATLYLDGVIVTGNLGFRF